MNLKAPCHTANGVRLSDACGVERSSSKRVMEIQKGVLPLGSIEKGVCQPLEIRIGVIYSHVRCPHMEPSLTKYMRS